MDLGSWNPDFDSNLLSVWSDGGDQQQTEQQEEDTTTDRMSIGNPKEDEDDVDVEDDDENDDIGEDNIMKDDSGNGTKTLSVKGDGSWDGNVNQWSHLGVVGAFSVDDDAALSEKSTKSSELNCVASVKDQQYGTATNSTSSSADRNGRNATSNIRNAAAISETASLTSAKDEDRSATGSSGSGSSSSPSRQSNSYQQNSSLLHPLAIQSSASCPPPAHNTIRNTSGTSSAPTQSNGAQGQSIGGSFVIPHPPNAGDLYSVDLSHALERVNVGFYATSQQQQQQQQQAITVPGPSQPHVVHPGQHLSSLATNFLLAVQQPQTGMTPTINPSLDHQQQHHTYQTAGAAQNTSRPSDGSSAAAEQQRASRKSSTAQSSKNSASGTTSSLPPFFLFDAPIELRANFMQNQRRLGLPIEHDPNSYHYGETVNGFHPQQFVNDGHPPLLPPGMDLAQLAAAAGAAAPNRKPPQLIDARHGANRRSSKGLQMKNEREQKRAQKITELIEQLRSQMQDGGWQVEGRSKFNTLSTCADYVKHMVKSTTEKTEAVKKLKNDMAAKQQKEEEDKAVQDGRSDPESVTSSLTADTTGSSRSQVSKGRGGDKKRAAQTDENDGTESSRPVKKKKRLMSSEAATEESSGEGREGGSGGSGSGSGSGSGGAQGCSIGKTISTVSDLTDSNRCSSSNNSGSGSTDDVPTEQDGGESGSVEEGQPPSTSSISSDAAVASEKSSRDRQSGHKDVVFKNDKRGRKRPPEEVTSLERSFELDYEEVFDKSNIPQIIATTSGKIISWNECFVKATGYRKSEIERMTIFSLVRPDKLSNFFDIVAAALRLNGDDTDTKNESGSTESSPQSTQVSLETKYTRRESTGPAMHEKKDAESEKSNAHDPSSETTGKDGETNQSVGELSVSTPVRMLDYKAITLPCIDFPAMKKRNQATADSDTIIDPLTVTVTLMSDKDPRRRCFHCVFTNCSGTNGALGSITSDLLASLFSTPLRRRKKHLHHHQHNNRHHIKRVRVEAGHSATGTYTSGSFSNERSENSEEPFLSPSPKSTNQNEKEEKDQQGDDEEEDYDGGDDVLLEDEKDSSGKAN